MLIIELPPSFRSKTSGAGALSQAVNESKAFGDANISSGVDDTLVNALIEIHKPFASSHPEL